MCSTCLAYISVKINAVYFIYNIRDLFIAIINCLFYYCIMKQNQSYKPFQRITQNQMTKQELCMIKLKTFKRKEHYNVEILTGIFDVIF